MAPWGGRPWWEGPGIRCDVGWGKGANGGVVHLTVEETVTVIRPASRHGGFGRAGVDFVGLATESAA